MFSLGTGSYGYHEGITFPLIFKVFKPKEKLKEGDHYQTKPVLAAEIIKELKEKGFQIQRVLADRKIKIEKNGKSQESIRVDELAASLSPEEFTEVQLMIEQPKMLWVAIVEGKISRLEGKRSIAIVMNACSFSEATEIDYFITNVNPKTVERVGS